MLHFFTDLWVYILSYLDYFFPRHGSMHQLSHTSLHFHAARLCTVVKRANICQKNNITQKQSLKFKPTDFPRRWRAHWSSTRFSSSCKTQSIWAFKPDGGRGSNNTNISSPSFNNTVLGTRYQNTKTNFSFLFRQYMKKLKSKAVLLTP